ncbi:PH domain-containing protein [Polynucleobacter paneuropaeus]|jgi:membrane protein YdbS with pleckstrin-like domain|nr:PH domain-containing protein [Polynucleobacter paneuropaeus]QWC98583.1 PH domain-containing protein [Polynucleobacter paneuropaeus]QWD02111.1 PH domain-containing protein [Polynucleobacter paneuropaeus]
MKYCTNCGAEVTSDAKFCMKCGSSVSAPTGGERYKSVIEKEPQAPKPPGIFSTYSEQSLIDGEIIIYRAQLHWIIYMSAALCFLASIFCFGQSEYDNDFFSNLGSSLFIWSLIYVVITFIVVKTSEFFVTNMRVICKVGFIRRRSVELFLVKVESIEVDQSILGRIFGYGTITITGTGNTHDPFKMISAPLDFKRHVQDQVAKHNQ